MAHDFDQIIYKNIPISVQFGVRTLELSEKQAVLAVPLEPNRNHHGTAFGGSIYATAVMSCWALVTESIRRRGINSEYVVVQDASIEYLTPIRTDFTITAEWSSEDGEILGSDQKFLNLLERKGRSRATISASVVSAGIVCARLMARFAAELSV